MLPEFNTPTVDQRERRLHERRLRFTGHLLRAADQLDEYRVGDVRAAYEYTVSDAPESAELGMRLVADFDFPESVLYLRFMAARMALGHEGVVRALDHYEAVRQFEATRAA